MNPYTSIAPTLKNVLAQIIEAPHLHAKWLNTLSFLENCGARMIASCEHPTLVTEEMLKHAAEEFRHAHYLKMQIRRVSSDRFNNYSLENMLGGVSSLRYLTRLNVMTSRYLVLTGLSERALKEAAYLLVTFAIELRAEELYPLYDKLLRSAASKVRVKSIALEEEEHLREMRQRLQCMPSGEQHAAHICAIEAGLFMCWITAVAQEVRASMSIDLKNCSNRASTSGMFL